MKILINLLNIFLLGLIIILAIKTINVTNTKPKKVINLNNIQIKSNKKVIEHKHQTLTKEEQIAEILNANLFSLNRTPNAFNRRSGRPELILVGTFEVNEIKGAIIITKSNTRQVNPFMNMMNMNMNNILENNNRNQRLGNRSGVQRFNNITQNNQRNNIIKQYVRVGETLSNGYTLVAVSIDHATLTKGNDKLELRIQSPSINQNQNKKSGNITLSTSQQLQQAQIMTQQMMVRALLDTNENNNRNQQNRNTEKR